MRAAVALAAVVTLAAAGRAQPVELEPPSADSVDVRTPRGAVTRALLLPGLGQVYNRQPLKAPIAAALVVGAAVYAVDRQRQLTLFRRATRFAGCRPDDPAGLPGDPVTDPERFEICQDAAEFEEEWVQLGRPSFNAVRPVRDQARGQRDVGVLVVAVAYGLQALEAFVSAELADFDVGEDLSIAPTADGAGLAVRVRL